jgi:hypothetical protein
MNNYTITLTETEKLALEYVAYDPQEWIENATKERARLATEEIVKIAVDKFLEANQTIPGSREEIVAAAYTNNWIQTAKYRTDNAPTGSI